MKNEKQKKNPDLLTGHHVPHSANRKHFLFKGGLIIITVITTNQRNNVDDT